MTTAKRILVSWPVIEAGEIDFHNSTPVISAVQKFVVPVPAFPDGGEALVYPDGHELAGTPVLAWNDSPIGERGVVFWNATDSCWQAAAGDGSHVVIINEVSEEQAEQLHRHFAALGDTGPVTLGQFKTFLEYAGSIGLTDTYQSDVDYVKDYLTPVMPDALQLDHDGVTMGFVKRDDSAVARACYEDGPFEFINAAGVTQQMQHGGVIVCLADDIHAVQPDTFCSTYRLADHGREIQSLEREIESLTRKFHEGGANRS